VPLTINRCLSTKYEDHNPINASLPRANGRVRRLSLLLCLESHTRPGLLDEGPRGWGLGLVELDMRPKSCEGLQWSPSFGESGAKLLPERLTPKEEDPTVDP
jgi:hypothetical protein